jgi:hypothetical protein
VRLIGFPLRALCLLALAFVLGGCMTAPAGRSRASAGLAPDPATTPEAVIQVYGARTLGAKGIFGVHTWIAVKPTDARSYTVYEVIGWRLRWGDAPVVVRTRTPDARWFGSDPELIADRRGPGVDALIERVDRAAREYPWMHEYTLWPGPNSNTFVAWIVRSVPELEVDLPPTAIGKDYSGAKLFGAAPSGSGYQLSLFGLLGLTVSAVEGLEVNVLGLTFGVNPLDLSLKMPLVGRIGPARTFAFKPDVPATPSATAP